MYPPVNNSDKETQNFKRIAAKIVGEENINAENLPSLAGEDFSFFQRFAPGTFFFMGSKKKEGDVLHGSNFDPNENYIPIAAEIWLRLVEDRFQLKF